MKVVWMSAAEEQLERIYEFEALVNPKYAAKVYNKIIEDADKYLVLPGTTARELSLEDMPRLYRNLVVMRRYKIIYRSDAMSEQVVVVSVWDCRRDPAHLRESVIKTDV